MDVPVLLDSVMAVLGDGLLRAAESIPALSPAELALQGFDALLGLAREHLREPDELRRALRKSYESSVRAIDIGLRGPGLLSSAQDRAVCGAFRAGVLEPFLSSELGRPWREPASESLSREALALCRAGAKRLRGRSEALLRLERLGDAGLLEAVARSADLRDAARLGSARGAATAELISALEAPGLLGAPHPLVDLLRFEDVLASGMAFYFRESLKSDERLSRYVEHLDGRGSDAKLDWIRRDLAGYRREFGEVVDRLEELGGKLDELSGKLDAILDTSVETHLGVASLEGRLSVEFDALRNELRRLASRNRVNPALGISDSFLIRAVDSAVGRQLEALVGRFVEAARRGAGQPGLELGRPALELAGELASVSAQLDRGEAGLLALEAGESLAGAGADAASLLEARRRRLDALLRAGRLAEALGYLGAHPEVAPFSEDFEAERVLGVGGMGVAWLCRKPFARGRPLVVLKTLWEVGWEAGGHAEAEANFAVEDPRVIRVDCVHRGAWRAGRPLAPFLEMEYFDAPSLDRLAPLAPGACLALGACVARGLAAIHRSGLIHRDVKPGNVLVRLKPGAAGVLESDWEIRIIDFGLASAEASVLAGSLGYAAPEQMDAELGRRHGVGAWSDVYGWGRLMYAALTGELTSRGWSRKRVERLGGRPWLELLDACLEHQPDERLRSMDEVLARLQAKSPPESTRRGSNQRR